jgi:RNA polymerase sigma-70 factor, ECF subfamily
VPQSTPTETLRDDAEALRRLARGLVRDDAAADDLTQDTWVLSVRRGVVAPLKWLAGVVRWKAREARRSDARRRRRETAAARPKSTSESPLDHAERLAECRRAVELVQQLPEPYRETLVLHYLYGQSFARISRDLGVPAATVRTQHARGLALLRERLDEAHGGSRRRWILLLAPVAARGAPSLVAALAGVGVVAGALGGIWFSIARPDGEGHRRDGVHVETLAQAPAVTPGPPAAREPALAASGSTSVASRPAAPVAAPAAGSSRGVRGRVEVPKGVDATKLTIYVVEKVDPKPDDAVAEAPVAADGSFTLDVERDVLASSWVVSGPLYEPGLRRSFVDGADVPPSEAVVLRPTSAPTLRVTAVDEAGAPLERARLNLVSAGADPASPPAGPAWPAMGVVMLGVGRDGVALPLVHDGPVRLTIDAERSAPWEQVLEPVDQVVRAVMLPSATIAVRVVGNFLASDVVNVTLRRNAGPGRPGTLTGLTARIGDGVALVTFESHIGARTYGVEVHSARHEPVAAIETVVTRPRERLDLTATVRERSDVGELRLRLRAPGTVDLVRLDVGVRLMLVRRRGSASSAWDFAPARVDSDSVVTLANLASGTYDLFWPFHGRHGRPAGQVVAIRDAVVRAAETTELDAVVEAAAWFRWPSDSSSVLARGASLVDSSGRELPILLGEGAGFRRFGIGDAFEAKQPLGPYPASALPLLLRTSGDAAPLTLEADRSPR